MRSCKLWSVFSKSLALASLLFSAHTLAVVNIDRTRIIFNANQTSQTLNLKNGPENPTVVQIWSDEGDLMLSPDLSKTPLFAMPPMMRLSPDEQRAIRLMLTTRQSMADDRESLYWLNIYQIPALNRHMMNTEKKIVLPLLFRLKIFLRPNLIGKPDNNDYHRICYRLIEEGVEIINPTPWHVIFSDAKVNGSSLNIANSILPPFDKIVMYVNNDLDVFESISAEYINDYGFKCRLNITYCL